jgi:integrase
MTESNMLRGSWLDPELGNVTLKEYAPQWLQDRRVKSQPLAPRTRDTYQHSLNMWILPKIGHLSLNRLTPAVVRSWHAEVSAATGPTASRQAYALLRAICNTAVSDELILRNPCRVVGAGQAYSAERPLLDFDQITAMADAMPHHLNIVVWTAFFAHLRLGEVIALRPEDLDLRTGTIRIARQVVVTKEGRRETEPKVGSRRTVYLPQPLITMLTQFMEVTSVKPGTPLFRNVDGQPLQPWHIEWAWRRAREAVGLPGVHFHDLRHAGLTLAAQTGATLAEIKRRAGHTSSRAALIYQHAADQRDAEIANRIGDYTALRQQARDSRSDSRSDGYGR